MILKRDQHIQLLYRMRLVELPMHISQRLLEVCRTPLSPNIFKVANRGSRGCLRPATTQTGHSYTPRRHRLSIPGQSCF
jgi:hypothetical protein